MSHRSSAREVEPSRENFRREQSEFAPGYQANAQDYAAVFGSRSARSQGESAALVNQGILPDTQFAGVGATADARVGAGAGAKPEDVLSNPNASAQQKLQEVEALVASGKNQITIHDKDGTARQVRLEVEHQGSKSLVEMYANDGRGNERVLLRGVSNGDGTYGHEKDSHGNEVSFNGSWWSQHMAGQSALTGGAAGDGNNTESNGLPKPYTRRALGNDTGNEVPTPNPYQPEVPSTNDQSAWNAYFDAAGSGRSSRSMQSLSNGSVYFKAGMAIDADGAPDARRIDPTGSTQTSLRGADGSSVNAHEVPYIVLPGGQYQQYGIHPGDMAAVRYNGKVVMAQFADVGPSHKIGEGSMNLAQALGINSNPRNGGVSGGVEYIVFPGSGNRRASSAGEIADSGSRLLNGGYES